MVLLNVLIDLSHWNSEVNFELARSDGIKGVIHKATEGTSYMDPTYSERRIAAEKKGLLWGAYHFGTGVDGKAQANHFLKVVGVTENVLLALDIEENTRGANITPEQADDFVLTIKGKSGKYPVIYGSANFLKNYATSTLTECPLWIASWGSEVQLPKGWNTWIIWQYTDGKNGPDLHSVKCVGACDRDKINGSSDELKTFWKK